MTTEGVIVVEVRGFDRVDRQLKAIAGQAKTVTLDTVEEWVKRQRDRLEARRYPPERPGQRYVRTFKFRDSWRTERSTETRWIIRNLQDYSEYVAQQGEQAWMHIGRWWTVEAVVQEDLPELMTALSSRYQQLMTGG
jgi:hypothetical protein